jgi:hypothetical protein
MAVQTDPHLSLVRPVTPRTPEGCEECLILGSTWVHLQRLAPFLRRNGDHPGVPASVPRPPGPEPVLSMPSEGAAPCR